MKCPYCDKEMGKGYMQGASEMTWTQKLHHLMIKFPKDDGIIFTSGSTAHCCCTAHLCRKCQKIIMDYSGGAAIIK